MSKQHRRGASGNTPSIDSANGRAPGKRTRTEALPPRRSYQAQAAPPAEIDEGRIPSDGQIVDASPNKLRETIGGYLNGLDTESISGEIARKALHDATAPDFLRAQLMNGLLHVPLVWQTRDMKYEGALHLQTAVADWGFETMEDGVKIGDESEASSEIEARAGADSSTTLRIHGGSEDDRMGGELEETQGQSHETAAKSGSRTNRSAEPSESVRFRLRIWYAGSLRLTMTPVANPLSTLSGEALATTITRDFAFFDVATVRFPFARCRPLARSA
jgi:hypothetical protein